MAICFFLLLSLLDFHSISKFYKRRKVMSVIHKILKFILYVCNGYFTGYAKKRKP